MVFPERVLLASETNKLIHGLLKNDYEMEGACALVTTVASTYHIRASSIPDLRHLNNQICLLRERRSSKNNGRKKPALNDTAELLERLSNGKAWMVGAWPIEPDDGKLIDDLLKRPTNAFLFLVGYAEGQPMLEQGKVTAIIIVLNYPHSPVGHVFCLIPDSLALDKSLRRAFKKIPKRGNLSIAPHVIVDLNLEGSFPKAPGIDCLTGDEIVEYALKEHPQKGKPVAYFYFVLSKS